MDENERICNKCNSTQLDQSCWWFLQNKPVRTLKIDASDETDYGIVAKVLAAARNAEVERIGFLRH